MKDVIGAEINRTTKANIITKKTSLSLIEECQMKCASIPIGIIPIITAIKNLSFFMPQ
jgi:hypothetical protein